MYLAVFSLRVGDGQLLVGKLIQDIRRRNTVRGSLSKGKAVQCRRRSLCICQIYIVSQRTKRACWGEGYIRLGGAVVETDCSRFRASVRYQMGLNEALKVTRCLHSVRQQLSDKRSKA
jgi:hypothetical protein